MDDLFIFSPSFDPIPVTVTLYFDITFDTPLTPLIKVNKVGLDDISCCSFLTVAYLSCAGSSFLCSPNLVPALNSNLLVSAGIGSCSDLRGFFLALFIFPFFISFLFSFLPPLGEIKKKQSTIDFKKSSLQPWQTLRIEVSR